MEKKVKNNAVEFWRMVFTIGVMFFHFNMFGRLMGTGEYPVNAIFKGNLQTDVMDWLIEMNISTDVIVKIISELDTSGIFS